MNGNQTTIETLRSFRIGGFAVFDFVVSFVAAVIIGNLIGDIPLLLYATLPLAMIFHVIFGQTTPLTTMTFGPGHIEIKISMVSLTLLTLYRLHRVLGCPIPLGRG